MRLLILAGLLATVAGGPAKCPPGQFFDQTVGKCAQCSDLCQLADIQGTESDCQHLCPGYTPETTGARLESDVEHVCPPEMFYDRTTGTCSFCSSLCRHHEIQGTTQQCQEKCPQEMNGDPSPPTPPENSTDLTPSRLGPAWIAVIVCAAVFTAAAVAAIAAMCCLCPPGSVQQCLPPRLPCLVYKPPAQDTDRKPTPETAGDRRPLQDTRPHSPRVLQSPGGYFSVPRLDDRDPDVGFPELQQGQSTF